MKLQFIGQEHGKEKSVILYYAFFVYFKNISNRFILEVFMDKSIRFYFEGNVSLDTILKSYLKDHKIKNE